MQARLAYRCALVLRDLIHPYLLRRQKKDLADIISLPAKTEQVMYRSMYSLLKPMPKYCTVVEGIFERQPVL